MGEGGSVTAMEGGGNRDRSDGRRGLQWVEELGFRGRRM